jgi:D-sedoheptulose 7-phosphate isomerase
MALTVDTSALTAIGNDFGFDQVFVRPIAAHGQPGDVFVGITTSGRSKNVLAAMATAKEKGMTVIVLTGEGGAALKGSTGADLVIAIPSGETARIQEMHELIYHAWCEYVDATL